MNTFELFKAFEDGEIEQVKILNQAGTNVNTLNRYNSDPLYETCIDSFSYKLAVLYVVFTLIFVTALRMEKLSWIEIFDCWCRC